MLRTMWDAIGILAVLTVGVILWLVLALALGAFGR